MNATLRAQIEGQPAPRHHHAGTGAVIKRPMPTEADMRRAEHEVEMVRREVRRDLAALMPLLELSQREWDRTRSPISDGRPARVVTNGGAQYG